MGATYGYGGSMWGREQGLVHVGAETGRCYANLYAYMTKKDSFFISIVVIKQTQMLKLKFVFSMIWS